MICGFCQQPHNHPTLGPLLGPIGDTEYYVHRPCALWSPEVHESEDGTLHRVLEAVRRGRQLKCSTCGKRGASVGCRVDKCRETYHALCAHQSGCIMFLNHCIACPEHVRRFKKDEIHPQPFYYLPSAPTPLKPAAEGQAAAAAAVAGLGAAAAGFLSPPTAVRNMAAAYPNEDASALDGCADPDDAPRSPKRRRLEEAFHRRAQAAEVLKRVRAQQRRAAAAVDAGDGGSDDEEHFAKREAARMQRDIAKLNPITLAAGGGAGEVVQNVYVKAPKGAPKTAAPQVETAAHTSAVDAICSTDFEDLAGMDDVVRQLREMVLLPLQYPEIFKHLGVAPPRGILFHGVPGTGKTLAARALAGACARASPVPVTFFARKGADCLGKFVGEAERTLRLMFQEASARAPSIIFLDELDALVPARSNRAGAQDQIHASVVSTLLSLMDGMADRGNVVVVAATNRPEDIDPALRRPGRFDREVYFGLPTVGQRSAIIRAQTRRWEEPPKEELLQRLAAATEGYAGADLASLCTAAVMSAVRRAAPELMERAEALAGTGGGGNGMQMNRRSSSDGETAADGEIVDQQQQQQVAAAVNLTAASRHHHQKKNQIPDISVLDMDWDAALSAASPPCSRRHAAQALAADAARPLAFHAAPLLLPVLSQVLLKFSKTALPLPREVRQAATAAAAVSSSCTATDTESALSKALEQLEFSLIKLGAVQQAPAHLFDPENGTARPSTLQPTTPFLTEEPQAAAMKQTEDASTSSTVLGSSVPALRLLISGKGEAGQDQIAGAVLRLFGSSRVTLLSLPAVAAEGAGDAAAGVTALIKNALQRADPHSTLVIYMPRVEAWAVASSLSTDISADPLASPQGKLQPHEVAARPFGAGNGALPPTSPGFSGIPALSVRITSNTVPCALSSVESDAWVAFDSVIKEAAPRQPLVLLATSSTPPEQLPSSILAGFEASGGVVCVNVDSDEQQNASEEVLEQALVRASEMAKGAVTTHAVAAFMDHIATSQACTSSRSTRIKIAGPDKTPQVENADGYGNSTAAASAAPPAAGVLSESEARRRCNLNDIEWTKAQELFSSVQRFLVNLGASLLKDRRCRAAGATVNSPKHGVQHIRLYNIALAAACGRIMSLEQLQGDISSAVVAISNAGKQEERTGEELLHHLDAVSFAHVVQDQIASACHTLRTALDLDDPLNFRLLSSVTAVAREIAEEYLEAERAAAAAARAAEMEAEEATEAEMLENGIQDRDSDAQQLEGAEGELGGAEVGEREHVGDEDMEDATDTAGGVEDREKANDNAGTALPVLQPQEEPGTRVRTRIEELEGTAAVHANQADEDQRRALLLEAQRVGATIRSHLLGHARFKESALDFAFSATLRDISLWQAVNEALPALVAKGMSACEAAVAGLPAAIDSDNISEAGEEFSNKILKEIGR